MQNKVGVLKTQLHILDDQERAHPSQPKKNRNQHIVSLILADVKTLTSDKSKFETSIPSIVTVDLRVDMEREAAMVVTKTPAVVAGKRKNPV